MFEISKILWGLLRPSVLMLLLAAGGMLLHWICQGAGRRAGRVMLLAGIGGLLAVLLLPLDRWALRPLEDRFPRPPAPAQVDGIIVLGGAIETDLSADRGLPSLNGAAERMTEFVALARRYPQVRLVFTGGNGTLSGAGGPEALAARALVEPLGVPPERVTYEAASRTTWDNAVFSFAMLHPQPGEVWLLVTSASHMPRAVGVFRHAGWQVTPWPVGYKSLRAGRVMLPEGGFAERLALLDWAVHEWTGLAAYRLLGRSDAWFPGPAPG